MRTDQASLLSKKDEQTYQDIFDNMLNGFAHCRMLYVDGRPDDFIYLKVNKAFEKQTGLVNVTGKKVSEVIPGIREADPVLFEIYGRVASGGSPEYFETYLVALQQWFSISVYCPRTGEFVAVFDVITDRKQIEKALRESEQRYRTAFLTSVDAVNINRLDDGKYLDVNEAFSNITGYRRDEVIGRTSSELSIWKNPEDRQQLVDTLRRDGICRNLEAQFQKKDGSVIWGQMSASIMDVEGTPCILSISRDITERKTIENAVRVSEQRYEQLARSIPDGIYVFQFETDGTMAFKYVSPRFCEMLGVAKEDVLADYRAGFQPIHPDDLASLVQANEQARISLNPFRWEGRIIVRGETRWMKISSNSTPLPSGGSQWNGVISDITKRKETEQLGELRQKLSDMVYTHEQTQLMQAALDTAEQLTESQIGFFHFVEKDQETVSLQTWSTRTLKEMCYAKGEGLHYPVSEAGVWVDCIHQRRPVIHNDYAALPHKRGLPEGHAKVIRELTVPVFRDKRIVAVIGVGNKPRHYDARDVDLVSQLADITFDFVERKQAERLIQFMAYNDVLTGLPNRQLFADRLQQAIALAKRSNKLLAICYLDLDGFKPVNDRYGHQAGDQLLIQLAKRLQQELREGDTLARLGGDEFVILLNRLSSIFNGEEIVERFLHAIAQPYEVGNHRLHISASIGVTFFSHDESDADTLLRQADQAMYKAKESGKNTYRLYDPVQDQKAHAFRKTLTEFEEALHQSELVLHYQPRIDLRTGELAGVEALVRWQHPNKGLLYPGQFLPMIEGSPLEIALDEWVLKATLEQHMAWRAEGLTVAVSVNITSQHIQQATFPEFLAKILAAHPEDLSRYLELEVLETSAIGDTAHVADIMNACAKLGVKFSLDDFGTGYSSLTYFHRLPISVLKIDQNFVRGMLSDPRDLDIVEGVQRLADALNRPVVAEGVETIELGIILADLGCQYAQGYGIAKPMPGEALPAWSCQWQSEEIWHRLYKEAQESKIRYDLHVAIFTHRQWIERMTAYLESDLKTERPGLDASACQFTHWYHGIGAARYGQRPSYPFVLAKHDEVHRLAEELVKEAEAQGSRKAKSRVHELTAAGKELIAELGRLAEQ